MDPIMNEINLTTLKAIYPVAVEDNFFLDTPFQAYLRAKTLYPWDGGAFSQNVTIVKPMIGGSYERGDSFNITKRQTLAGTLFQPKLYEVAVPEFLEDIKIFNKGQYAKFKLIDLDMRNAMNTISAIIGIALNNHGRAVVTGVDDDRHAEINGWPEALNDGVTNGYTGDWFTSYGTQARNGFVGSALNSVPVWGGDQLGNAGPVTYNILEESYQDASIGRLEPDLGVGNKAIIAYVKERIQAGQRFSQEKDPYFGATGFRMNSAIILKDDYFPSLRYGQNDPDLGNWLTSSFTSVASPASQSNMPGSMALTVGEVFCWFNTSKWLFRIDDSKDFGFGFTGFIPAQDNTRVVGHIKGAVNLECLAPRLQKQLFGFNG
jgi:hypothetical protein